MYLSSFTEKNLVCWPYGYCSGKPMAQRVTVHPDTPQPRAIEQICEAMRRGTVMLYPTDTVYAIGCDLQSKSAIERVRQLKRLANDKPLTFLCPSLSNIAKYAHVSDAAYRLMRHLIPGPFTFILPATKLVPKLVLDPKRKTTGIRVPEHPVAQALLAELGNPIISISATVLPEGAENNRAESPVIKTPDDLFEHFEHRVDLIVDNAQSPTQQVSSVIDLCGSEPVVLRQGLGWQEIEAFL
jgi:tRNA threonylcarbamoyl adenosine modification protein (Sua5/YciO/YrdC/YwlC family)